MKMILIDSGTTNSRLRLVDKSQNEVIDILKIKVGVRNTAIEGNNNNLKKQLTKGINALLTNNNLNANSISYIVASGMITSNLGIYEVPHILSPASLQDFVKHSVVVNLNDFYNIPCIFVPGMTNNVPDDNKGFLDILNDHDVMRGEEVESFGLLKQIDVQGSGLIVLPGSHTKYVIVDEHKSLTSSISTLGGEVLQALQKETILSNSLDSSLVQEVNTDMLKKGFESTRKYGLTRTLYHIRLIDLFSELSKNDRANYFVGAILHDDIKTLSDSIKDANLQWIIVGGSNPLREAFVHLLSAISIAKEVIEATDEQVEHSLVEGARDIASEYITLHTK
ncbi:2-dehydro-3-deoxygalactonokinase [Lentibacillus sp. JNUCC-1]|uniref:2-dehydro-3-deoxygalactonokinase n=1 Tax=Lentibacillus sp. JNUCC-1 TaxID=2654513 RepID=UPI0012E92496|nr:2-dehydro-3-deoxygalactonokinase [Lentibacillus sp. JNUCC-1]